MSNFMLLLLLLFFFGLCVCGLCVCVCVCVCVCLDQAVAVGYDGCVGVFLPDNRYDHEWGKWTQQMVGDLPSLFFSWFLCFLCLCCPNVKPRTFVLLCCVCVCVVLSCGY